MLDSTNAMDDQAPPGRAVGADRQANASVLEGARIVVVVGDRKPTAGVIADLRSHGAVVAIADVRGRGLEAARDLDPEVVLVDPRALVGVGAELARRLADDPRLRWASIARVQYAQVWPGGVADLEALITPLVQHDRLLREHAHAGRSFQCEVQRLGPNRALRALERVQGPVRVSATCAGAVAEVIVAGEVLVSAGWWETGPASVRMSGPEALAAFLTIRGGRLSMAPLTFMPHVDVLAPVCEALHDASRRMLSWIRPGALEERSLPELCWDDEDDRTTQRRPSVTEGSAREELRRRRPAWGMRRATTRPSVAPPAAPPPAPPPALEAPPAPGPPRLAHPQVASPRLAAPQIGPQIAPPQLPPPTTPDVQQERARIPSVAPVAIDNDRGERSAELPWIALAAAVLLCAVGAALALQPVDVVDAPPVRVATATPPPARPASAAPSPLVAERSTPPKAAAISRGTAAEDAVGAAQVDVDADSPARAEPSRLHPSLVDDLPDNDRRAARILVDRARERGTTSEAERLYELALERFPHEARAMAGIAEIHLARGDAASAVRWARRAADRNPRRGSYRVILGDALNAAGDRDGALRAWIEADRIAPGRPRIRRRLNAM